MKKFVIFGNPVSHSKSPLMQNSAFMAAKFDGIYEKYHLEDGTKLKEVFLQNGFSGANITVPHKEEAFKQADEVRGIAKAIGAVNTYIKEGDKVIAYNTDAPGFMRAIESFGMVQRVLIIGAGGTAKALALILKENQKEVYVTNRSASKLDFFKDLGCETFSWCELNIYHYDLVVNTTSAGLGDDEFPMPEKLLEGILKRSKNAFDCIYGKKTPFLKLASSLGLACKDGRDMLLYQGVLAFEYFTNNKSNDEIIKIMSDSLG